MKHKKSIQSFFIVMLLIVSVLGNSAGVKAFATPTAIVLYETIEDIIVNPGETLHVKLPIRTNAGTLQVDSYYVTDIDSKFVINNISLTVDGIVGESKAISNYSKQFLEFDLTAKETAIIGNYNATFNFTGTDAAATPVELSYKFAFSVIKENAPAQITVSQINYDETKAVIGNEFQLKFNLKNEGEMNALSADISVDYGDTGIIADYTTKSIKVGDIAPGASVPVTLPLSISTRASKTEDTTPGIKTITIKVSYKDAGGEKYSDENEIYINVTEDVLAPKVEIIDTSYPSSLKIGDTFNLEVTLKNNGGSTAEKILVVVDETAIGPELFLPNYTTEGISLNRIKDGDKTKVTVPLIVSKGAQGGIMKLPITVTYVDSAGVTYTTKTTLYPDVKAPEGVTEDGTPNIVVNNVNQSPTTPYAGGDLTISFDLENKSNIDVRDMKIAAGNLSATTFSPQSAEPYQYVTELKANNKSRVTMSFTVSDKITEGLNTITIQYTYTDANGKPGNGEATIYVLNVVNEEEDSASSTPKLIVSDFTTSIEELRAGEVFTFLFDIKNTHSSVAAKNIKVTVVQAENIFSITSGSNSFFIDKISAGETYEASIELKVKSDAVTKAYPIEITMEYEYDGAVASPVTGEIGETAKEVINLQAVENTRPKIDSLYIDSSWSTPTVGESVSLYFEFYNLGKSPLSNVYASVEGDFQKSDGSGTLIGNVQPGTSSYVEMYVTPLVEGQAKGKVIVTFEDSNGEEVSISQDFEAFVEAVSIPDNNWGEEPGIIDPGITVDTPKKAILPVWQFVLIQVGIVIVFVPVSRKVVLALHRRKLRKEEEQL